MKIVICDIDGTLADCHPEKEIAAARGINCRHWFENVTDEQVMADTVIEPILGIVDLAMSYGYWPVFITGREKRWQSATVEWLDMAFSRLRFSKSYYLFMRRDGDRRPDAIVKRELWEAFAKAYEIAPSDVLCALDDRDEPVAMWRSLGITCLQVRESPDVSLTVEIARLKTFIDGYRGNIRAAGKLCGALELLREAEAIITGKVAPDADGD